MSRPVGQAKASHSLVERGQVFLFDLLDRMRLAVQGLCLFCLYQWIWPPCIQEEVTLPPILPYLFPLNHFVKHAGDGWVDVVHGGADVHVDLEAADEVVGKDERVLAWRAAQASTK